MVVDWLKEGKKICLMEAVTCSMERGEELPGV